MPKQICEISAPGWFYYKEICYDARSHERKIRYHCYQSLLLNSFPELLPVGLP